ncbi:MAG: DUF2188 domain-containing protein [Spirochaetia bacterium]|nr:DUF2188 domain-containing protein [Spirochaetia bacterium]
MALREHHVVPTIPGGLDGKRNGSHTAIIHANTKATALEQGSILSKVESTGFIIQRRDGRIQRSERHGIDPYSLRG